MFVAHGLWAAGVGLLLWTESTAETSEPGVHPFAVNDPARLASPPPDWSGPLQEALTPEELTHRPTLLLPTCLTAGLHAAPLPSPDLRSATTRRRTELAAWQVPASALAPPEAADLLLEIDYLHASEDGAWTLGAELRFLAEVASGVARWVYSGRVVPVLRAGDGGWSASWVLVDDGPIRAWRTQLVAALPPVLRAQVIDGRTPTASEVVVDLLDALCDAVVRATLSLGAPFAARTTHPLVQALETGEPLAGADELSAVLQVWGASSGLDAPEVVFRLVEPPDDADLDSAVTGPRWLLETCLRTGDTPPVALHTLPYSAAHSSLAMNALGRAMSAYPRLRHRTPNVREHLLTLSTAEAVDFVSAGAPALRSAGITVLLPRAWTRLAPSLTLEVDSPAASSAVTSGAVGMDQLLSYRWRLALGDVTVSSAEMAALAKAKAPLVRLRGEWVQVDPTVLGRAARYLAAQSRTADSTLGQLLAAVSGADSPPVPVAAVRATGWIGELLDGELQVSSVGPPEGLCAELRPYQQRGLDWLAFMSRLGLGVVLADDMGLGKTVQVLALQVHEKAREPTLVVCPMSVVGNWQREVEQFAPQLQVLVHHGADRGRGEALSTAISSADLVITTYHLLARDRAELTAHHWDRVVLDEAQHVKNPATAHARAARSLSARHRLALTGTPVENRLEDLRSVLDFVNPGMLGSAQGFRARFAVPIEREHDTSAVTRLRTATAPFVLRRLKTDPSVITDLPSKLEMTVRANLTAEQAALYRAVVDDMLAKIAESRGMHRKALVLSALTRLKQVCNHPAHFLADGSAVLRRGVHRSGKLELVQDILHSALGDGGKVLMFTQFRQFGELVAPWIAEEFDVDVPFLHGGVSKGRRDSMVEHFQRDDGPPVMLLSLKAGGTGLNLTAANHVVHLDRWWNPAVENQATDRAFRIGQRRDVQVRKLVCVGTVEERIDALILSKRELADLAVGSGESWVGELDTEQLREMLTLGEEAVGE